MDKKQSLSLIHFLPVQTLAGELLSNMLYLIAFQHNATLEVFANSKTMGVKNIDITKPMAKSIVLLLFTL